MKKDVGMTIAQKSKETRVGMKNGRMEMGSIFCSVYPAAYTLGSFR